MTGYVEEMAMEGLTVLAVLGLSFAASKVKNKLKTAQKI